MGRIAKFVGIGCGGLIVLFVILGIIGAIVGGGETASESEPEPQQAEENVEEAQRNAEQAQEDVVEEAAEAESEQQEFDEALQDAEEAGVAPEPAPEAEEAETPGVATIRITGEEGQSFSGSYGNIDTTQSVDGVVPTEFEQEFETGFLSSDIISVVMQKNTPGSWELGVEIVVDGEVVQETSTTAEYGVAQVTWDTLEQ